MESDYMTFREFVNRMGCCDEKGREILHGPNRPPSHRYGREWAISRDGYEEWRKELDARTEVVRL